ncbi:hypothetical protein IV203_025849 [Nitzschia inconspicua]|uniref:Uncharacterized protein n=1 Tax=Nitzschia inconspicua TaxID=303405 RepID=A0A9K3LHP7_9STRA|nr:hypothetical protein IV203_025849 [Nitzschia inconspicua]
MFLRMSSFQMRLIPDGGFFYARCESDVEDDEEVESLFRLFVHDEKSEDRGKKINHKEYYNTDIIDIDEDDGTLSLENRRQEGLHENKSSRCGSDSIDFPKKVVIHNGDTFGNTRGSPSTIYSERRTQSCSISSLDDEDDGDSSTWTDCETTEEIHDISVVTEEPTLDSQENAFGFMVIVLVGATEEKQEQNGCGVCIPMLFSVFEIIGNTVKEDKILTAICIHEDEMTEKESESAGNVMRAQSRSPSSQTMHDIQEVVCHAISLRALHSRPTVTLPTQVHIEKFTPDRPSYREKGTKNRKIWCRTKLWYFKKLLLQNQRNI